jgi:class 3 adenylate cyclase
MLKKGRKRRNWNQRWFVLVGPFLLYYENPQDQIVHELIADAVLFLKDYVLITTDELQSKCASIRSYDQANVLRTMQNHPDCFVLQSKDRELFLEPPPQSARSHSTAQWVRKLRLGMQMGQHVANKDAALEMLLVQGSGLVDRQSALPMVISDACLSRVFRETLPQEQKSMLGAMDQLFTGFPPTLPTLVRPTRYLQRCGKLKHLDGGIRSDVAVFLFNDILLCADLIEERHVHLRQVAQTHMPRAKYRYAAHHSLVDLHYEEEIEGGTLEFAVKVKGIQSLGLDAEEHSYAEFRSDPTLRFEAPSKLQKLNWAEDLRDKIKQAKEPSNNMERFEGAVIFADVSGFSNLGDLLERKEREALVQSGTDNSSSVGPSAAEGLATFLGIEVEKMVEVVTRGGGDVIKFAGDCVIAVFPAEDYLDLEKDLDYAYTALALATGQAARVSVQMVNKQKQVVARAQEKRYEDDISRLVAELNIHVAIGSGMVYGYHVGGVDRKWEYLIDGPVMSQVRSADGDAGAGEVALSKEAYELVKSIDMKKRILKTGNVRLITYHGPQQEPNFKRPWETLTDDTTRANLAKLLMQYAAEPVVEQVEAQLPTVAQHKLISTAFCRLIGIDYDTDEGEVAVMELGAITSQVQLVLRRHGGTLTRVISDDKGTSMLLAFEDAHSAVEAAVDMHRSIVSIPVAAGMQPFKTAIGITTGNVWIGCVGGRIRSEYTMHGSHVNFAARLMTCPIIKNVGGILCDEATMRAAPGIDFISQEPRQFKGFTEKVVSYMPHMPVTSRELSEDSLQRQVAAHREEVGRWETLLQGAGMGSGGQGALVVVETSQENHWHLDSLFEAIDKRRNQHGPKVPVRRCCWPMFETSPVAGGMASGHRSSDTRNEEQLKSLLAQHSLLHDSVHVVERANVLSATGWAMLYKLAEQSSRRKYSGGVLVITLNSAGRASRSGAAALESACASAWSWSALAPSIAFLHMVWCHGKVQPHFASDEVELSRNSMGLEPEPEEETEETPSRSKLVSPAVHRPRIRTADLVGVDRLYTLKVAAVLSHDVGEGFQCGFPAQMMLQLHPMVLTKQWGTQTVDSHLRYFAENADPSTGRATLHRIASSFRDGGGAAAGMCGADDEGYYVFDSVQLQQFRYRQMIFQQRSRIHRNAAAYFRQKMRSDLSGDEDRVAVAVYQNLITFHREAAGMKAIPQ